MTWAGHIAETVRRALAEDLGGRGDITSRATIEAFAQAQFVIRSRQPGVLASRAVADECFAQTDPDIRLNWLVQDGERLQSDAEVVEIRGRVRSILTAERTALNFLGRLSGIATLTRAYVDAVAGTRAEIAHTRKTTPGLRALELAAVRAGGGASHRFGLDDAILIKDNHVAVCGDLSKAIQRARRHAGHMTRVAVEVDRLDQLQMAVEAGADSILLDNFPLENLRQAVEQTGGAVVLEASGGVDLGTVRAIAETGVDIISVGAITHSVSSLDLGLDLLQRD